MMKNEQIQLTEEQKKCVEYPLDKQVLVIDANPGTGKTEVLKNRILFIHRQNEKERKLILVLAYGRNIAKAIRNKLKAEKLKVYDQLKKLLPQIGVKTPKPCRLNPPCKFCLKKMQPLVLVCTIHSLANGIIDVVIKKQFKEKRKIQIFATNQSNKQKQSFIHTTVAGQNQKFIWNPKGQINYHKSKLFNYLLSKIWPEYLDRPKRKKLWEFFKSKKELKENVLINAVSAPYYHYDIDYSLFLTEAKSEFSQDKELLIQLEKNCRQDKEKNIWLDYEDIIIIISSLVITNFSIQDE